MLAPQIGKIASSIAPDAAKVYQTTVAQAQTLKDLAAALTQEQVIAPGTVVAQNQNVTGLIAGGKPLMSAATKTAELAARTALTAAQWDRIVKAGIQTRPASTDFPTGETFGSLANVVTKSLGSPSVQVTLDDLTEAIVANGDLLAAGGTVKASVQDLAGFATKFQNAFPGQCLAMADDRAGSTSAAIAATGTALFAVLMAKTSSDTAGIFYNIRDIQHSVPLYFAPAPLANTLQSGTANVDTYVPGTGITKDAAKAQRFDAVDVNVLARDLLVAVEAFLDPVISIPALAVAPDAVKAMLAHKETLADAIYDDVTAIVVPPTTTISEATLAKRRTVAANLLRRQLLVNLVEGFDVECIMQSSVEVSVKPASTATFATAPRLVGLPVVSAIRNTESGAALKPADAKELSFTLSPAEAPLRDGDSYLTFLFDTRTPEKYEGVSLDLDFRVNQLEYDIVDVNAAGGIGQYQSSSWLSFILPIDGAAAAGGAVADASDKARHRIGELPIVVPLRTYPVPPSLVSQQILADPDSLDRLEGIREWDYQFTYGHPDVAQDAIDSSIRFNLPLTAETVPVPAGSQVTVSDTLFTALLDFSQTYKVLWPDLQKELKAGGAGVKKICDDLAGLVGTAAHCGRIVRARRCPAHRRGNGRGRPANCGTRSRSRPEN